MKYFKEEPEDKILLSTYLDKLKKVLEGKHILQDEHDVHYLEYLISIFGDIEMDGSLIKVFISQFRCGGGRYLVRTEEETLKGVLEFSKRYEDLSSEAIDDLFTYYIEDIFEECLFTELFQDYLDIYGKEDETFKKYIEYVDQIEAGKQKKYDYEADELYKIRGFRATFIEYLRTLIKYKHYHLDDILKCLPESELVEKDTDQLLDIATRHRIMFSGTPISHTLTKELIKGSDLSDYPEELTYYVKVGDMEKKYPATFTKSEFIESTKRKQKIK